MAEETFHIGEHVLVFHGPLLYDAVVLDVAEGDEEPYLIHFQGWNKRHDTWVPLAHINKRTADNLKYQKELQAAVEGPEEEKEKTAAHKKEGHGLYRKINGINYDRAMLEAAEKAVEGPHDGRISIEDAKKILKAAFDDNKYTEVEKRTLKYIRDHFKFTEKAEAYTKKAVRKFKAKKAAPEKKEEKKEHKEHGASKLTDKQKEHVSKLSEASGRKKVPNLVAAAVEEIGEYHDAESHSLGSESAFKKALRAAFRRFDANHNNMLERDELAEMMRSMGRRPLKSKIDAIFDLLDEDGDGSIDFGEFLKYFKEHHAPLRRSKSDISKEQKEAEVAKAAEALKKKKHEEEEEEEKEEKDGDAKKRARESLAGDAAEALIEGSGLHHEKYSHSERLFKQQLRQVFNTFDSNSNNVITKGELAKALKKLGKKPNKARLDAIFATLDVDGNGEIDFDEFVKYFHEKDTEKDEEEVEEPSSKKSKKK